MIHLSCTDHLRILALASLIAVSAPAAVTVTSQEMAQKNDWVQRNLLTPTNTPPFSFSYASLPSSGLLSSWTRVQTDFVLDGNRTQHILTWTNANFPLHVQCVVVEYNDYPAVEWTVYLKNVGTANTALIKDLKGLQTTFARLSAPEFVLNGNKGDFCTADSYEPFQITLGPSTVTTYAPPGSGKSSDGANGWPYWNLQEPGGGTIIAVGWPGQWSCSFARDNSTKLRVTAGQELTSLYLAPGEKIRTPLTALLFWKGTEVVRSQNLWRHWFLAHNMPRVDGQLPTPQLQIQIGGDNTNHVASFMQAGIMPTICWRDAGGAYTWYPNQKGPYTGNDSWLNTGTWEVDPTRYPVGFKPFSDWIHQYGIKFMLWCEPERVGAPADTWLGINHPEWLLQPGSVGLILNEGNPTVFNWLTNHFDTLIKENGVDWYREDMNGGGPCSSWRANDASNRQGITENFYVQNHLAFWDALLAMNPGLRIDSCASGGRRNDLETMRRAVPLLRSDFAGGTQAAAVEGNQGHTYGLSSWLPFQGTGVAVYDPYVFRSFYLPSFGMDPISPTTLPALQQGYGECKKIAPSMLYGDYYPLTPYSLADNVWMAWQFDRSETGEGVIQAFRRPNSTAASMQVRFQGLTASQLYRVEDFDRGDLGTFAGTQLMSTGLVLELAPQKSAVLYYTTPAVAVSAIADPLSGAAPLTVQFSTTGVSTNGGPVTYAWTFGDGGTSPTQNPLHTYSMGGRYIARVIAQDSIGKTGTGQVSVLVMGGSKKMKVSFTGYNRAENLVNFPALVVLGPDRAGFNYNQFASINGWDLTFLDATGTRELKYEIESWNTNGNSCVWIQLPELKTGTFVWAYWGDTNRTAGPPASQTNGVVWENGYVGVWHLGEKSGYVLDSSASRTLGSAYVMHGGVTRSLAAKIGSGYGFNGGYVSFGAGKLPAGANQRTVSAWFKKDSATSPDGTEILGYGDNSVNQRFGLWIGGNGTANALGVENCGGGRTFPYTWDSQWHHLAAVLPSGQSDLSGVQLYYDGNLQSSATGQGNINTAQEELCLAAIPGYHTTDRSYDFVGGLDEVRISNVARSANWLWAEWMSAASNSVFSAYGPVVAIASPPFRVNQMMLLPPDRFVVCWESVSGQLYTIEACTNLVPTASWTPAATGLVGLNTATTWTGQLGGLPTFFRIKAE